MTTKTPRDDLSLVFARVNGMLLSEETVEHAVGLLAQAAKCAVPRAIGAGVSLISSAGRRVSAGSTDSVVRKADDLQYSTGEGPCLSAWASHVTVNVNDVRSDRRWPDWSAAVVELPVRSVLSTPLEHRASIVGAMKVYSSAEQAFTLESARLLTMFAGPAAALLAHVQTSDFPERLGESITDAMSQRDMINIAKGVLMDQRGFDKNAAALYLIQVARSDGLTVRETAERIIAARRPQGSERS
ncbi:GAF and ANTAR domain-containing protein [Nesterenkonia sp. CF4.4]|uniref:GAF and ANTAR domain-containing protein n=1 Tax=Nesterenkonia sp. CF4.4 TaxID=3373079 RepID=UPI003EE56F93